MTPLGSVYHPGNIQETAHYIIQVEKIYVASGNATWLLSHLEGVERGVHFLKSLDKDGNHIPEGTGIMEIGGFYRPSIEMVDVAAYTLQAYVAASKLYQELAHFISESEHPPCPAVSYLERIDCKKHSLEECESHKCQWSPVSREEYQSFNLSTKTPWCHYKLPCFGNFEEKLLQKQAEDLSESIREIRKFLTDFAWLEEQDCFAELFTTPLEAVTIIKEAIQRVKALPNRSGTLAKLESQLEEARELMRDVRFRTVKRGWNIYQSWITSILLEQSLFPPDIARRALNTARQYSNKYGMYVTGIDRPDSGERDGAGESHGLYTNAVMTLPTGVQAVAEARYGNMSGMLEYLQKLGDSFSYETPGSLHEMSPQGGCFVQAWSIYSIAVPIVEGLFGIQVSRDAGRPVVVLKPQLPVGWEYIQLKNAPLTTRWGATPVLLNCECTRASEETFCEIQIEGPLDLSTSDLSLFIIDETGLSPLLWQEATLRTLQNVTLHSWTRQMTKPHAFPRDSRLEQSSPVYQTIPNTYTLLL